MIIAVLVILAREFTLHQQKQEINKKTETTVTRILNNLRLDFPGVEKNLRETFNEVVHGKLH